MKTTAAFLIFVSTFLAMPLWAAKLECKTGETAKHENPYFQGFQIESEGGKVLTAKYRDIYGNWEDTATASDSRLDVSVNKDGSTHVRVSYNPAHDEHEADLDLKTGKSIFQEYSFEDCVGEYNLTFPIECNEVRDFSK